MDIFQQWLLLRIQENFGVGTHPMEDEIPFDAIVSLIKPIFEQENAQLDESELQRNLDALVTHGYLSVKDGIYSLTFRAMIYSQTSPSLAQVVKDEFGQYVSRNWLKVTGIVFLLVLLISILASVVTVNILLK